MTIALAFIHNKGTVGNANQVATLESGFKYKEDSYSLTGSDHKYIFIEIVPHGILPPTHTLKPKRVVYQSDRPETTGILFNFALSRGFDYLGADIVIYLSDVASLNSAQLASTLTKLTNNKLLGLLENESFGTIVTKQWYTTVLSGLGSHLDDTQSQIANIATYKGKAEVGGLVNG